MPENSQLHGELDASITVASPDPVLPQTPPNLPVIPDGTPAVSPRTDQSETHVSSNVIEAITLNGSHPNEKVLLHRMDLNPSESKLPFRMRRRQFPVTLSFAMTINKSQGQSLKTVGVYLPQPVFTHGQLYVALSRVKSMEVLKIYVPVDEHGMKGRTKNVVYKEVFINTFI